MSAALWTAPLAVPLLAAVVALAVPPRRRPVLAVLAPLPALLVALVPPSGPAPDLSWLLLDVRLVLGDPHRVLLAAIALVWVGGGTAARDLLEHRVGTASIWLLALFGNLGVVMAGDVITLYAAFSVLTFAAYPLVVHERTAAARRAGRVYLVMALVGEAALLSGLMLAASATGSTALPALAGAVAAGEVGATALGLMAAGFAVKVGIVPVHVWLPLAHPAAPVPASAVLSGAMIKAGIAGWLKVLPLGAAPLPRLGTTLLVLGLVTVFLAAVLGLLQHRAKVVLAYSSISQMGFIAVIIGVAATAPAAAVPAAAAASVYVLHHGLAKATLFLSVGVRDHLPRWLVVAGSGLAGLALAGAPLTSGFLAKLAAKDVAASLPAPLDGRVTLALSLGAIGTTLLIARFLVLLVRDRHGGADDDPRASGDASRGRRAGRSRPLGPVVAWGGLLVGVVLATFLLPGALTDTWVAPRPSREDVVTASWPVLLAAGLAVAAVRVGRRLPAASLDRRILVPPGDAVELAGWLGRSVAGPAGSLAAGWGQLVRRVADAARRARARHDPIGALGRLDEALTRWRAFGVSFVTIAVLLAWALTS